MLYPEAIAHITSLSDNELIAYLLAGSQCYEQEALDFARQELDRRALPPDQLTKLQAPIISQHAQLPPSDPSAGIVCQMCGREAPTRYVEYHHNVGFFAARMEGAIKGHFCRDCNRLAFRKSMLTGAFLGWWGFISFFLNFVYLIGNIGTFLETRSLEPVPPDAARPQLNDDDLARLGPHLEAITARLSAGNNIYTLAREFAPLAALTPGQVLVFLQTALGPPREGPPTRCPRCGSDLRGYPDGCTLCGLATRV